MSGSFVRHVSCCSLITLATACSIDSRTFDAEEQFANHLEFLVAAPVTSGSLPGGSSSGPTLLRPAAEKTLVVAPGSDFTFEVAWQGGVIDAINLECGGRYHTLVVGASSDDPAPQHVSVEAHVGAGVCDNLSPTCHSIAYREQLVGFGDEHSRPLRKQLWLDCADEGCADAAASAPVTPEVGTDDVTACSVGATECASSTRRRQCNASGRWQELESCDSACVEGVCTGECAPGASSCTSSTRHRVCSSAGFWSEPFDCADQACVDGTCAGECKPGTTQCSGNDVQLCGDDGRWQAAMACETSCQGGSCLGECTPGLERCLNERDQQVCSALGQWSAPRECEFACDTASGACTGECKPGASQRCDSLEPATRGVCATRTVLCDSDGRWQRDTCAAQGAAEICDANEQDEDCDGQVNELAACAPGFTAISAGLNFACGIDNLGGVACWGLNSFGEIGDGSFESRSRPVAVAGVSNTSSLVAGTAAACAVSSNGGARCWGKHGSANGAPLGLAELSNLETVIPGQLSTCALLLNGSVRCTQSDNTVNFLPVRALAENGSLGELRDVESIDATHLGTFCALMRDGSARCWGPNLSAEGNDVAVLISGVSAARQVVAGESESCALLDDGGVTCWSGVGPAARVDLPVAIAVDAGGYTCAILQNRSVRCWGALGPEFVSTPVAIGGIAQAASISVGFDASCVVRTDGTAQCFGDNRFGQLGNPAAVAGGNGDAEFLAPVSVLF